MASQSPFSALDELLPNLLDRFPPPPWVIQETQRRAVLLLNHVLSGEPQAMERLVRLKGKTISIQWRQLHLNLVVTPAGLLDVTPGLAGSVPADLALLVTDPSILSLTRATFRGDKPAVRIDGDVQMAAEINWLVDHVRWDVEEDLAKIVGDAPAHAVAEAARRVSQAVKGFAGGVKA